MSNAFFDVPIASNEPVKDYAPGSAEKKELKATLKSMKGEKVDLPMVIGGENVGTKDRVSMHPPHELKHHLGVYRKGDASHVKAAIRSAMKAHKGWSSLPWTERASVFLRAAELLAGPYRARMNAATMLGQSKNVYQAEIDAAAEMIDFFRYNVQYMAQIFMDQPESVPGVWNRMEYRALEGFVLAVTPFNFTSICANLCAAPALMGNVVVWKPARTQIYSAAVIMDLFKEAGLPDGVVNLIHTDGSTTGKICFEHPDFAGLHFTGGTGTFQGMWASVGQNISNYKAYPRIVGETGGKDFILAHPSANSSQVAVAMARGAFEYQGQKCSAASRAYIPKSLWRNVKAELVEMLDEMKMGSPEDFGNFVNAVIDEKAFDSISGYISRAKKDRQKIIAGGGFDKAKGYFIQPTVIQVKDPGYRTMCEEIFGPVLSVYVYEDKDYKNIIRTIDKTSPYALTGAVFSNDRQAVMAAYDGLRYSAGNFYINDKPTGAVVGQQPFGGARASGTNDKAGSMLNLLRWTNPRTVKENLLPPKDWRYPFLGAK